jgi:predicted HAD superfamily Cof-like phosphohydrolase
MSTNMNTNFEDVQAFHRKFGAPTSDFPMELECVISEFRIKFLTEELEEYIQAVEKRDLAGQFDALIDIVYVALGTANMQGFPWQEGFDLVQAANMKKISATAGHKKITKPEGWIPPDIEGLIEKYTKVSF